jgi:hypothetical protein
MIEVGQVLTLKIRFKNSGETADRAHPCLVVAVDRDFVEIAQFSSLRGKEYKAARRTNWLVCWDNPKEAVIDRDGFVQLDNKFTVENSASLESFRRQPDKLSPGKLDGVLSAYRAYHAANAIEDNRIVHMTEAEVLELNE